MSKPIRVLVVDDSVLVRLAAREQLSKHKDISLMDAAADALAALQIMCSEWPDVIVLDLQMPHMDGMSFLRKVMAERPTPIVVCSSLVGNGAKLGLDALAAGAVSLISKPKVGVSDFFADESDHIVAAVRAAAQTNVERLRDIAQRPARTDQATDESAAHSPALLHRVIAMGASTGGVQALEAVLSELPEHSPGIVIAQHMPIGFTQRLAQRLEEVSRLTVREAEDGEAVLPGVALIAPAGKQTRLVLGGRGYRVQVGEGPLINRHRPSVDCLFSSVARVAGRHSLGVLMTGMGDDGALGMKELFDAGAHTIAEAEETCIVFGMPRVAVQRGGVREVAPLQQIAKRVTNWAMRQEDLPTLSFRVS